MVVAPPPPRPAGQGVEAVVVLGCVGGLGIDAIVAFSWEAELGEQRLTKADLAALARAVDARRSLVRLRGQWVEIDLVRVGALLESIGTTGTATAGDLLRAGMGLNQLGVDEEVDVVGVDASAVPWLSSLLDDALHATVEPIATPAGFDGELRPYQGGRAGWRSWAGWDWAPAWPTTWDWARPRSSSPRC